MTLRELYIHLDEYHFEPHCASCSDLLVERMLPKKDANGNSRTWKCRNCKRTYSAEDLMLMIEEID